MRRKTRLTMFAVALAATTAALTAWAAGSKITTLNVTASVPQNCLITANAVSFGDYDPVAANSSTGSDVTATGSVSVTCTKSSTGVAITLGGGSNAVGATRRLAGTVTGDFLTYELYQPSAATAAAPCAYPGTVWNATTGIFSPNAGTWGATSAFSFNICGSIPKAQNVSADAYTDAIVLTINF
jgi:spore coat protein U-like protein